MVCFTLVPLEPAALGWHFFYKGHSCPGDLMCSACPVVPSVTGSCCGGALVLHSRFWPQLNPSWALVAPLLFFSPCDSKQCLTTSYALMGFGRFASTAIFAGPPLRPSLQTVNLPVRVGRYAGCHAGKVSPGS